MALEVVAFRVYAQFSVHLPCFKCILESVFYEGVQHRVRLVRIWSYRNQQQQ
jgi:hypothetical protein